MKKILTKKMLEEINKIVEANSYKDAIKKELEIIYPSLVSMAEYGLEEINTPIGTWEFKKG